MKNPRAERARVALQGARATLREASSVTLNTLYRPLYAIANKLKKIEDTGGKEYRIAPKNVPMPMLAQVGTHTVLFWPIAEYSSAFIAWTTLMETKGVTLLNWPFGEGMGATLKIRKSEEAPNDAEAAKAAADAVAELPSLLTVRQQLDDALRKIDPAYNVRSKMRHMKWIIGVSVLAIAAAVFLSRRDRKKAGTALPLPPSAS